MQEILMEELQLLTNTDSTDPAYLIALMLKGGCYTPEGFVQGDVLKQEVDYGVETLDEWFNEL